ncbi:DUF4192 domain-containing protein [Streptomyces sp. NBC_01190]|uniref:DUF4192 domain-containing protein n=1 Tax=Streptomyces sp. NBC_01190 TaxID=2903767 RepID=UPI003863BC77|nr:DUF4192 domain-containing protein [Streptomyces sp. NBC_01190]
MTQSNETQHTPSPQPAEDIKVTLRGPAELADALPYLLGFHPSDSLVLVALHGEHGRFGGRLRLGLPRDPADWPGLAKHLAECLVKNSTRRGARPDAVVVFFCQDPREGEQPSAVMERLRPLAQQLRIACGELDVPVVEALCVSAGRWWSYCGPEAATTPAEGDRLPPVGSTAMAATAAYVGLPAPGSLRDMEARLKPAESNRKQEIALDIAAAELVPRMLRHHGEEDQEAEIRKRTLTMARAVLERFRAASPISDPVRADRRDDRLLRDDEAAGIILGLQDRGARDRAAEWMEPARADAALRLWRAVARRCVGPYGEHAAAPLALAGWVAWSSGDDGEARIALGMALDREPHYTFARLLHHSVNEGLDPELLRHCLRQERRKRVIAATKSRRGPSGRAGRGPGRHSPGDRRVRTRR